MFTKLTKKELLEIVNADDLDSVLKSWNKKKYKTLINLTKSPIILKDTNKGSRSAVNAISTSMAPIDFWWLLGSTLIPILATGALLATLIIMGLSFFIGACYFCSHYDSSIKNREKLISSMQLTIVKSEATEELIRRKITSIKSQDTSIELEEYLNRGETHSSQPKKLPSKIKSCLTGMGVTAAISISYLFGVSSIFETLGYITLASALTGPIGIAIAITTIGIAIGIGAYLGYQHYQGKTAIAHNIHQKKLLETTLSNKNEAYTKLKKINDDIKLKKSILSMYTKIHTKTPEPRPSNQSLEEKDTQSSKVSGALYYRLLTHQKPSSQHRLTRSNSEPHLVYK